MLQRISSCKYLYVNTAVGKLQETELLCLQNFETVKLASKGSPPIFPPTNDAQEGFFLRRLCAGGFNRRVEEGTKNVFCYSLALQQHCWCYFGGPWCWLHRQGEHSCAFLKGDMCQKLGLFLATQWHAPCISRGFLASLNNDPFVAEYLAVLSILMSVLQIILRFDGLVPRRNWM